MKKYQFTIIHDQGQHKLSTYAKNLSTALKLVMDAERCPEGAIINIKITDK
jgi:hypothetical protein